MKIKFLLTSTLFVLALTCFLPNIASAQSFWHYDVVLDDYTPRDVGGGLGGYGGPDDSPSPAQQSQQDSLDKIWWIIVPEYEAAHPNRIVEYIELEDFDLTPHRDGSYTCKPSTINVEYSIEPPGP